MNERETQSNTTAPASGPDTAARASALAVRAAASRASRSPSITRIRLPSGTSPKQRSPPSVSTRSGSRMTCSPSARGMPSGCVVAKSAKLSGVTWSP
jgi:hypothetical protein